MKKIILLVIFLLLLTGCASVDYSLDIEKDLSVVENVKISATKDYFESFYKNLPITIVREAYNNEELMKPLKDNNYDYNLKNEYPYPNVYVKKKYTSLDIYQNTTVFKGQVFNNINVVKKDNLITINATDFIKYNLEDSDGELGGSFPVSELIINIKVPYVVTDSNADSVDKKNNIYKWVVNEKTEDKEIKLTFDKNRIFISNLNAIVAMIIIIIIVIGLIVYFGRVYYKNKNNNLTR